MDDVLRKVVHLFTDEVKEQTERISAALILMESDRAQIPTQIEEVCRQAHSLKGAASSLGVGELEALAHAIEEAMLRVRRGEAELTPALVDITLRAMDAAQKRGDGLRAGTTAGLTELEAIGDELRLLTRSTEGRIAAPPVLPAPKSSSTVAPEPAADAEDTLRVAANQLMTLERRLDELRALRGRLDQRAASASALVQVIEQLWRQVRATHSPSAAGSVQPLGPSATPTRDGLYQILRQVGALRRDLADDAEVMQASALELDENLRALRMVPTALLQDPLQRALRDACRRTHKEAQLQLVGHEAQIDRRLLEELKHPLMHLVRNAVDHGVEPTAVREAVGKPSRATITVAVEQRGPDIVIEVRDDGRGVDIATVCAKAVERGLVSPESAGQLSEREVHELLFAPGFSTAEAVTELSGRGVGLDVVRDAVLRLHGRVELSSVPGRGTTFSLSVPLTLAASEAMLVEEGGRMFALPQSHLERIVRAHASELRSTGGRVLYHLDNEPLPVVHLAPLLGLAQRHDGSRYKTLAVLRSGPDRAATVCERLLGTRDLVLRPLPSELQGLRLLNAAAILPNGQPILVLSAQTLVQHAMEAAGRPAAARPASGMLLVADDSITTRALLRHTLELSGFRVLTAADGDEALRLALTEAFDLVVSDVNMPRLDGFELTARLRANPRTAKLPVVLCSSLDSDDDKRRGAASGANAFLTKGAADRGHLVEVVCSLIRGG